jgi:uncharacterized protein (TIGR02284 family)
MLVTDQKPFEILNQLILINHDRIEGYSYASRETDVAVLKALFSRLTETSLQFEEELCREVYKIGGRPQEGAIASVDFFKAWMEVMAAIGKNDHKAILNSCFYEEGVVIRTYEEALRIEDENITTQQQLLINRQYNLLTADQEKVKNLLDVLVRNSGQS